MNISDSEYFFLARIKNINENLDLIKNLQEKQIIKIISYDLKSKNSKQFIEINKAKLYKLKNKIGKPIKVLNYFNFLN